MKQALETGLASLGLNTPAEAFLNYLNLLNTWNQAYNLTAGRDPAAMISRHVLDSLAVLPWLEGQRILDVGSGAGLPGIPLAIARPEVNVVLLDSNGKKTRFLQEVKRSLSLNNVTVVQARAENYQDPAGFDTVVSRAFTNLDQFIAWTQHLLKPQGLWLAMKGLCPEAELVTIKHPYRIESYAVAGQIGERCCVIIENKGSVYGKNHRDC